MIPRPLALLPSVALLTCASTAVAQSAPERFQMVHVSPGALQPTQWSELLSGRYDIAARFAERLEVIVTDAERAELERRGIPFEVAIDDLTSFYASRLATSPPGSTSLGTTLTPGFGQGSIGGFYTFDEVVSVLDQLAAQYPALISAKQSIGTTIEGRDIWAVKISDNHGVDENEPEARFDSMHHSREPQSMQSTLWFMLYLLENYGSDSLATFLVNEREMWFVPVVNPDGFVYNQAIAPGGGGLWRKNRRDNGDGTLGVDLNRNYPFEWGFDDEGSSPFSSSVTYRGPFPSSEPETTAMVAFFAARDFQTALSTHSFSNLWLSPFGYDFVLPANNDDYLELGALATETSGYLYGPLANTLYLANGGTVDQDHGAHGTMSWTPEIGDSSDGFWPPSNRIVPLAEETLLGFQRTALAAGAYVRLLQSGAVDADTDGAFEAGEVVQFDLALRNSGLAATATPVLATLSSSSPWVTIDDPNHDFGSIGAFSDSASVAGMALTIDGGAPAGTVVEFSVEFAYEGYVQSIDDGFIVGTPTRFVHDPLEVDFGWTAGVAGDTASTGIWERGDPIGTDSGGEPANPEDDASPSPGVACFVTGNGGGTGGTDDVDDGETTLLTPVMDLSAAGGGVEVRYARWYADLSAADDVFEVSISDDGGSSWSPLETVVGVQNEWTTVGFQLTDFVSQTDAVQLRFVARDEPNNSVVEAGIDELEVRIYESAPRMNVYGTAEQTTPVAFHVTGEPGASFSTFFSLGTAQIPLGFGDLLLDPSTLTFLYSGVIPADRSSQTIFTVGGGPGLPGTTVYFQTVVVDGVDAWMTNRAQTTILP